MRFLVDAQLPRRLAREEVTAAGHHALHTLDLPDGNATSDTELAAIAVRDDRVLVTKDHDFRVSHLLSGRPRQLLHVTTGNISNRDLMQMLHRHLPEIIASFDRADHIDMGADTLTVHERP